MIKEKLIAVNNELEEFLHNNLNYDGTVGKAMNYSIIDGGKRIRPFLLLAFYELLGGKDRKSALGFATALEMIHTYSLIHDDLPCMDNDDMRRGKPSCHKVFGETTALLAGDALLTNAFSVAANNSNGNKNAVIAIAILSERAGVAGMIGGQELDLEFEKREASLEEIKTMYLKKTGALLSAATEIGAVLADADKEQIALCKEYAENVGLAFQIIDDILDITADEQKLGKPVGSDSKNNKRTIATVLGLKKAREYAAELTNNALTALNKLGGDNETLIELTNYLLNRDY